MAARDPSADGIVCLYYHAVDDRPMALPVKAFRRQVGLLEEWGFRTPSPDEVRRWVDGRRELEGREALVTFDDVFRSAVRNAAPILAERGFSGGFFVATGYLGRSMHGDPRTGRWSPDPAPGRVAHAMADEEDVRSLADMGMWVGAHTRTHPNLPDLDDEALRDEVAGGKAELEAVVGAPVETFAYPRGRADERSHRAAREAGFRLAFTTRPGAVARGADPHALPRTAVGGWIRGFGEIAVGRPVPWLRALLGR